MAKTQQELIIIALKSRGYTERKRQGKYLVYGMTGESAWLLLGKAGAVRICHGSIANSYPVSDKTKGKFLEEGKEIYQESKKKKSELSF